MHSVFLVVQSFSFLEWHMISAKNLYCFFELRFAAFVFTCSRRDYCFRSHYETSKPAPIFSQLTGFAASYQLALGRIEMTHLYTYRRNTGSDAESRPGRYGSLLPGATYFFQQHHRPPAACSGRFGEYFQANTSDSTADRRWRFFAI